MTAQRKQPDTPCVWCGVHPYIERKIVLCPCPHCGHDPEIEMRRIGTTPCADCGTVPAVFGLGPDQTPECRDCNWKRIGIPDLPRRKAIVDEVTKITRVGEIVTSEATEVAS